MLAVRTLKTAEISKEGKREMFYLMKYSTHFISGYVPSDIWKRTIQISNEEILIITIIIITILIITTTIIIVVVIIIIIIIIITIIIIIILIIIYGTHKNKKTTLYWLEKYFMGENVL